VDNGKVRSYGRDKCAIHLPADHPACAELKEAALFTSTYRQHGQVIAYDFCFPKSEAERLREIAESSE